MDIELDWKDSHADIIIEDGDIVFADDEFASDVIVSLFTDERAELSELDDRETDRRGWWVYGIWEHFGSLIWTVYERQKITQNIIGRLQSYSNDSLKWLNVTAEVKREGQETLYIVVDGQKYGI